MPFDEPVQAIVLIEKCFELASEFGMAPQEAHLDTESRPIPPIEGKWSFSKVGPREPD